MVLLSVDLCGLVLLSVDLCGMVWYVNRHVWYVSGPVWYGMVWYGVVSGSRCSAGSVGLVAGGGHILHSETAAGSLCGDSDSTGPSPLPHGTRYVCS